MYFLQRGREQKSGGGVRWGEGYIFVKILVNYLVFIFSTYKEDLGHKNIKCY